MVLDDLEKEEVRRLITEDKVRPDGRKIDEIRPLDAQVDILGRRVHGSAMFTRGQTQICDVCTLAPLSEMQKIDGLDEEGRAALYTKIASTPSEELIDQTIEQTLSSLDKDTMLNQMIQGAIAQTGMKEEQITGYLSKMSEEELTQMFFYERAVFSSVFRAGKGKTCIHEYCTAFTGA